MQFTRKCFFGGILGAIAFLGTVVVVASAWICDDALITLRYVDNTARGYGPVFNVGERVMGYTHPLWFLLLLAVSFLMDDLVLATIFLGIILTFSFLFLFGISIWKYTHNPLHAILLFSVSCCALISSDIWVSFQTGGLENPLAHLLLLFLITEAYTHGWKRPALHLLWLTLLCLTRPDYLIFALPIGIMLLSQLKSGRDLGVSMVAVSPAIIWSLFALWYYGSLFPNTGAAKLGVYPNMLVSAKQGLIYLLDWCLDDPLAASVTITCMAFCGHAVRARRVVLAQLIGVACYALWVICIGGDFMRGRFFMFVFTASVIMGSYAVLDRFNHDVRAKPFSWHLLVGIYCFTIFNCVHNARSWQSNYRAGIVNERRYYPGYALRAYLRSRRLVSPYQDLSFADDLRNYAGQCGPITVHSYNPGTIGYLAGPNVTVIDLLGLVDKYIANLPKRYQVDRIPRPGHVLKYIPVSYLASRGDIALLPQWRDRVRQGDCTLTDSVKSLINSSMYLGPNGIVSVQLPSE